MLANPPVGILSWIVFLPLVGAGLLYLLPVFKAHKDLHGKLARAFAFLITILAFVLSLWMLLKFDSQQSDYQFVEHAVWIPQFGISYHLGVDGLSVFLVLLTTFLMPLVVMASTSVHKKVRGYLFNMLLLETAMLGTLLALDLFLFYVFWELMLAPMYFIIGIWGGKR
ncbi:MAG: Fe-S-binding domain-containing protein, partial [Bdellovibrionales bacterium]|nr:Fe-S-binding domain-containing protein [Bdellovibrionales bacterium]